MLRGLDGAAKGCSKNSSAVGPRLGKSRLFEEPRRESAHREGKATGGKRVEGVSFRAKAIYELLMDAVVPLCH